MVVQYMGTPLLLHHLFVGYFLVHYLSIVAKDCSQITKEGMLVIVE
jgi:hypothetical protein